MSRLGVAGESVKTARVVTIAQEDVARTIENLIARKIDGVVPVAVAGRIAVVGDGPGQGKALSTRCIARRIHGNELQVRMQKRGRTCSYGDRACRACGVVRLEGVSEHWPSTSVTTTR